MRPIYLINGALDAAKITKTTVCCYWSLKMIAKCLLQQGEALKAHYQMLWLQPLFVTTLRHISKNLAMRKVLLVVFPQLWLQLTVNMPLMQAMERKKAALMKWMDYSSSLLWALSSSSSSTQEVAVVMLAQAQQSNLDA